MSSRLKPGSRASVIYEVTEAHVRVLGRGADIGEIREAYERSTAQSAPKSFTAEVCSLVRRGLLERVGGRNTRTLYAPPGSGLEGRENAEDDVLKVLGALRSAHARLKRAISTREVEQELRSQGGQLVSENIDAVRKALETLARDRARGAEGFHAAQVVRVACETGTGIDSGHWVPAENAKSNASPRVAPRSRADAIRYAVLAAEAALQRPVSRTELRWWRATPGAGDVHRGMLSDAAFSDDLGRLARQDAGHAGTVGRLHAVRTEFSCHGGPGVRYLLLPPSPLDQALCGLEDAAFSLRPADEEHGIWVLSKQARVQRLEGLAFLAELRRDLLVHSLQRLVDPSIRAGLLAHRLELAGEGLRRWAEITPKLSRDQEEARAKRLSERVHQIRSIARLLEEPPTEPGIPLRRVGEDGLVSLEGMRPYYEAAADLLDLRREGAARLLENARRFPAPVSPSAERFGRAHELSLSLLDRVDALTGLFQLFPVPRANALLASAQMVLGGVLRDADVLTVVLGLLPRSARYVRRALVIALGLLGRRVEFKDFVGETWDAEDVAAWVLAAGLADPAEALSELHRARRACRGGARRVVEEAVLRWDGRYYYSLIG